MKERYRWGKDNLRRDIQLWEEGMHCAWSQWCWFWFPVGHPSQTSPSPQQSFLLSPNPNYEPPTNPTTVWVLPPKPGNPFPKTPNCPATEMDVDSLAGPALSCLGWVERECGCWLYRPSVKPYVHRRSGHPSKVPKALANCSSQKSQVASLSDG